MLQKKFKRGLALLLMTSMIMPGTPWGRAEQISAAESPNEVIYENTFEDEAGAELFDGSNAMKQEITFTGSADWDTDAVSLEIQNGVTGTFDKKAVLSFDVKLPAGTDYNGILKVQGIVKLGNDWIWTQSDTIKEVKASNFSTSDNGQLAVHVMIPFENATMYGNGEALADYTGDMALKMIGISLHGYSCDLVSSLYIDNIRIEKSTGTEPAVQDLKLDFESGVSGWSTESGYQYQGPVNILPDALNGSGVMKLGVDYSQDAAYTWSEAKINYSFGDTVCLTGYNKFTMDFIYNPADMLSGTFKLKLFASDGNGNEINVDGDIGEGIDYIDGLKKAEAVLTFPASAVSVTGFTLGIVGNRTDYSGNLYLDNMVFTQNTAPGVYVAATKTAMPKTPVTVSSERIIVNGTAWNTAPSVKLADDQAGSCAAQLYAYLEAVGKTEGVLFGHQNDIHHKAGNKGEGFSCSDTKDVTGSIAGVVGIDTLSLTGNELGTWDQTRAERVAACADMTSEAASGGAIITLSAHMPNFEIIDNRVKNNVPGSTDQDKVGILSDGTYNFSGYTPGTVTGNIVERIMPGQDLNYLYTAYLDLIAEYAYALEQKGIPVLFRPFHEGTGSWFWWGAAFCDSEAYKNLYKYTVEYLRDEKQVHNFLYVYGPGSEAESTAEYAKRYPGDDYVDMVGFDMYHQAPAAGDSFMEQFENQLNIVQQFAREHGKLFAVTETGVANGSDALLKSGNERKDWYKEILDRLSASDASYFLLWANFGENSGFYTPYVVSRENGQMIGHEMLDNFIDFYNDSRSIFGSQTGDYTGLAVTAEPNNTITGYITAPVSGKRILDGVTLEAKVKNAGDITVKFIVADKNGMVTKEIPAIKVSESIYRGEFTGELLNAFGEVTGTISLAAGNTTLNTINVKLNMPVPAADPNVVDSFETYYGEDAVLNTGWSTGKGAGCSVEVKLTEEPGSFYKGSYGAAFNYKLVSGGYAGITKSLNGADWSSKNALRLWTVPDGKAQKVVVQVTSGGNVFEVYLNEYQEYLSAGGPVLVTIPFAAFTGRDNKTAVFNPASVESFGLWCNAVDNTEFPLTSVIYYDEIEAVESGAAGITFEFLQDTEEPAPGPSVPVPSPDSKPAVISEAKMTVTSKTDKENGSLTALVDKILPKKWSGSYLALDIADQEFKKNIKAKVNVSLIQGVKPGDRVHLYGYNEKTNQLERLNRTRYSVDKDGYITIKLPRVTRYVILPTGVTGRDIVSRAGQSIVSESTSVNKGRKKRLEVGIKDEYLPYASITYKSADNRIAKVDKRGTITGVKKGSTVITVTVRIGEGKKTFKAEVIVK